MCNSDFEQISETDFKKISNSVSKIGYVDGLTDGKEYGFQQGFDLGYANGLKTGLEITKWKNLISNSTDGRNSCGNLTDENIPSLATESCHFQMLEDSDKPIQEIAKIQNDYIENLMQRLKIQFPKISNALYCKE